MKTFGCARVLMQLSSSLARFYHSWNVELGRNELDQVRGK